MFAENYSKYYDLLNKRKDYKQEVGFVYKWAGNPKSILDIGCGTASYWKFFPEGVRLKGIEASESMVKRSKHLKDIYIGHAQSLKWAEFEPVDCAVAFFDVVNYIQDQTWWRHIPIKKGGFWIFDIWDKAKVRREGFKVTTLKVGKVKRTISPAFYNKDRVELDIETRGEIEAHKMYLHSFMDIEKFCGKEFEIADIKNTNTWQQWYKCVRK